jgi:pimeloyl-ACP methyl ester carboxylesterase
MEEFYLDNDGIKLHAKLDRPEGVERCPLAIVLHGLTGHMEEEHIVAVSAGLNRVGVATLRVELYGHGKSGGGFAEHTLYKWITNVLAVIDFAKTLDWPTELFLGGHSQGGLTTMLVAGMRPDDLKAIFPLSPAIVIADGARRGEMLGMTFDPAHIPDRFAFGPASFNGNYFRVAQTLDVDGAIARYLGPVLLVHGDQDQAVPVHYSLEAAEKYANAELVIIENDDHNYHAHLDQVVEAVQQFIQTL